MTGFKLEFNDAAFAELRTRTGVAMWTRREAERICAAANAVPSTTSPPAGEPYYKVVEAGDGERSRYMVMTTGPRAVRHEHKTHALQRAISSGG